VHDSIVAHIPLTFSDCMVELMMGVQYSVDGIVVELYPVDSVLKGFM